MEALAEFLADQHCKLTLAYDPNHGGDGARIRLSGDTHSFRRLAALLTLMASTVDDTDHPASQCGWHLGFHPSEMPQWELTNATIFTLDCSPSPLAGDERV